MQQFVQSNQYIKSEENLHSLTKLLHAFETHIKPDGVRNRAYLKLIWHRASNKIIIAPNQAYYQSAGANTVDGGKVRHFAVMDNAILQLNIMKNIIEFNINIIKNFQPLRHYPELVLGLHFIQYKVNQYGASYSSPDILHVDDEPLVFVHLLNLTSNAWGGDNLIADIQTKEIKHNIRLEKPLETLILTQDFYHAVTPLGAREGEAKRDILLFTVEPGETQKIEAAA